MISIVKIPKSALYSPCGIKKKATNIIIIKSYKLLIDEKMTIRQRVPFKVYLSEGNILSLIIPNIPIAKEIIKKNNLNKQLAPFSILKRN